MPKKYDDASFRANIPLSTGLSVAGTAASATVILRLPLAGPAKLNKARIRLTTGGTAAGPTITFGKSLAGTGTVSAIGTYASGTSADGVVASVTLTSTDFDANDEIVITTAAGTAAATPVIAISVAYVD